MPSWMPSWDSFVGSLLATVVWAFALAIFYGMVFVVRRVWKAHKALSRKIDEGVDTIDKWATLPVDAETKNVTLRMVEVVIQQQEHALGLIVELLRFGYALVIAGIVVVVLRGHLVDTVFAVEGFIIVALGSYVYSHVWNSIRRTQDILAKGIFDVAKEKVDALADSAESTLGKLMSVVEEIEKSPSIDISAIEQVKALVDELAKSPFANESVVKRLKDIAAKFEKRSVRPVNATAKLEGTRQTEPQPD